jgi:hypothetical protein
MFHFRSKGIVTNFIEVLKPLSFREAAVQRYITSLKDKAADAQQHDRGGDTKKSKTT